MRRHLLYLTLAAFCVLTAAWLRDDARLSAAPAPARGPLTVLDGVTYENITVFPIVTGASSDTSAFVTLDEGLASGDVIVREMGGAILRRSRDGRPLPSGGDEVNRLVLINRGHKPVLLLAGELVSGGKQDRVIGKDRIVPAGGDPLPLDVFCVEHGRWTGSAQFSASKVIVHPSVREQAAVAQSQTRVWASVREATTAAPTASVAGGAAPAISARTVDSLIATAAPSESYAKVYRESRIGQSVEAFAAEVERRFNRAVGARKDSRLVGVVVAYGGEVAWSDVFASNEMFDHYWPKLLRSYATEALARPATIERAHVEDAREFLAPLRSRRGEETIETEPGVFRWRQLTSGRRVEIDLEALPTGMELHTVRIQRTGL